MNWQHYNQNIWYFVVQGDQCKKQSRVRREDTWGDGESHSLKTAVKADTAEKAAWRH